MFVFVSVNLNSPSVEGGGQNPELHILEMVLGSLTKEKQTTVCQTPAPFWRSLSTTIAASLFPIQMEQDMGPQIKSAFILSTKQDKWK